VALFNKRFIFFLPPSCLIHKWKLIVVFGRQFVKRFALCYRTVVLCDLSICLSVLSVMLVCCGQTIEWIKMKLGMQVGLGHGHIVLDGDQLPSPKGGRAPQFLAHVCCGQVAGWIKMPFGREVDLSPSDIVLDGDPAPPFQKGAEPPPQFSAIYLLWPNGWMDQDATWHGGRSRPRPHCARWGPSSPFPKSGRSPPIFGPCLLWPNGWMDEDAT